MEVQVTKNGGGIPAGQSPQADGEQLEKINRFARRALTAEEVFVFPVILCDNEVDRDLERFPKQSLEALGRLYVGKTGVFDHDPRAANQSARIFEAAVEPGEGQNSLGEPYCHLKAWAYMARSRSNADLIFEIDAGIKKEVSVGCAVGEIRCAVCGADQKEAGCGHVKGQVYDGILCHHLLENPTDAYEWSFVAVPAQRSAGVVKRAESRLPEEAGTLEEATLEKLFSAEGDVVLRRRQLEGLAGEYRALQGLARAGREYLEGLRKEAARLVLLAQPDLEVGVLEQMLSPLDSAGLQQLALSYRRAAERDYPLSPQLAGPGEDRRNGETGYRAYTME